MPLSQPVYEALLIATGFTGALTLVWAARSLRQYLRRPEGALKPPDETPPAPDALEAIARSTAPLDRPSPRNEPRAPEPARAPVMAATVELFERLRQEAAEKSARAEEKAA